MKNCFVIVGVSGSGKSTLVDCIKTEYHDTAVFSLDAVRLKVYSIHNKITADNQHLVYSEAFDFCNNNKKEFDNCVNDDWAICLKHDNVIVDNTNLTRKARARWIQDARSHGFRIIIISIMIPLQIAIDRQRSRKDKSVPENVVREMYMRMQEVQANEYDILVNWANFDGADMSLKI